MVVPFLYGVEAGTCRSYRGKGGMGLRKWAWVVLVLVKVRTMKKLFQHLGFCLCLFQYRFEKKELFYEICPFLRMK